MSSASPNMNKRYSLRDQPLRGKTTTMNHLRLRRLMEHNSRLWDDLQRPRIRTSEASLR